MNKVSRILTITSLLVFSLIGANTVSAQDRSNEPITFLGVDFSMTQTRRVFEDRESLRTDLLDLNDLFIKEAKKYFLGNLFPVNMLSINVAVAKEALREKPIDELFKEASEPTILSDASIDAYIEQLDLQKTHTPLASIILCSFLDKEGSMAYYSLVIFDTETRGIISVQDVSTRPKGFGVRNYWARSVLLAIKAWER